MRTTSGCGHRYGCNKSAGADLSSDAVDAECLAARAGYHSGGFYSRLPHVWPVGPGLCQQLGVQQWCSCVHLPLWFHPFCALQDSPGTCPLVPGSVRSAPCNASVNVLRRGLQQGSAAGGGFKPGADAVFLTHLVCKTVLLCLQTWSGSFSPTRRVRATRAVSPGPHFGERSSYCIRSQFTLSCWRCSVTLTRNKALVFTQTCRFIAAPSYPQNFDEGTDHVSNHVAGEHVLTVVNFKR